MSAPAVSTPAAGSTTPLGSVVPPPVAASTPGSTTTVRPPPAAETPSAMPENLGYILIGSLTSLVVIVIVICVVVVVVKKRKLAETLKAAKNVAK